MKCDKCGNEATVHEVTIRGGKKVERHLCESCARSEGIPVQPHLSVPQILGQFITEQAAAAGGEISAPAMPSDPARTQCPACGTTYAQFRHTGLLGCPECYASFEVQLGPLLQRAHEGGTHHVGKIPQRIAGPRVVAGRGPGARAAGALPARAAGGGEDARRPKIETLKKQLSAAVAAEQYEAAAKLRDELRRLEGEGAGSGA